MANQNYQAIADPHARMNARMADYNKYAAKLNAYRTQLNNHLAIYNAANQHLQQLNALLMNAYAVHGPGSQQHLLAQANLNANVVNIANIVQTHDELVQKVQSNNLKRIASLS